MLRTGRRTDCICPLFRAWGGPRGPGRGRVLLFMPLASGAMKLVAPTAACACVATSARTGEEAPSVRAFKRRPLSSGALASLGSPRTPWADGCTGSEATLEAGCLARESPVRVAEMSSVPRTQTFCARMRASKLPSKPPAIGLVPRAIPTEETVSQSMDSSPMEGGGADTAAPALGNGLLPNMAHAAMLSQPVVHETLWERARPSERPSPGGPFQPRSARRVRHPRWERSPMVPRRKPRIVEWSVSAHGPSPYNAPARRRRSAREWCAPRAAPTPARWA